MNLEKQKTILITGATDGIGKALARIYQADNARLVLVGRRLLDELEDDLYDKNTYCQADLSTGDCADKVHAFLTKRKIAYTIIWRSSH